MPTRATVLVSLYLLLMLAGCATPPPPPPPARNYDRPLPPGRLALRRVTDLRDWPPLLEACADREGLSTALARSLHWLAKPSSRESFPCCGISHARVRASLKRFQELLAANRTAAGLADAVKRNFNLYSSIGCDDRGTVLYTGYYTPVFAGSRQPTARFRHSLYGPPKELVKDREGRILGIRRQGGTLEPCPSRAELPGSGLLAGREVIWLEDPFQAYIAHVQGSAHVRLPGGELITLGYAGCNGHPYRSVATEMVRRGLITQERMSLAAMIDHFRAHPEQVAGCTNHNPRFVFFQEVKGTPRGSLNEPVTPRRTLATDKSIFPPASLTLFATTLPRRRAGAVVGEKSCRFGLDQDTGGAIKAPGRCDIYLGTGAEAGELAGRTRQEGRLYYLFLRQE